MITNHFERYFRLASTYLEAFWSRRRRLIIGCGVVSILAGTVVVSLACIAYSRNTSIAQGAGIISNTYTGDTRTAEEFNTSARATTADIIARVEGAYAVACRVIMTGSADNKAARVRFALGKLETAMNINVDVIPQELRARAFYSLAYCYDPTNNPSGSWEKAQWSYALAASNFVGIDSSMRKQCLICQARCIDPRVNKSAGDEIKARRLYAEADLIKTVATVASVAVPAIERASKTPQKEVPVAAVPATTIVAPRRDETPISVVPAGVVQPARVESPRVPVKAVPEPKVKRTEPSPRPAKRAPEPSRETRRRTEGLPPERWPKGRG